MRKLLHFYFICLVWLPGIALAESSTGLSDVVTNEIKPRIGLVLSGGGARGAAHIGVLKRLEELHVPIHCIAGTSIGGLVGGAYSTGMKAAEMEQELTRINWRNLFDDAGSYADFSPRIKELSQAFIPGTEAGLNKGTLALPPSVLSGQKIQFFLNRLIRADKSEQRVEKQPIPMTILATDIVSGKKRVYRNGNLAELMRATMSVPGLMTPVKYEGHTLIDGGLVDNLPVEELRKACQPDVIIAVNVSSLLLTEHELETTPLSVTKQMIFILGRQNLENSIALLRPGIDIHIQPKLDIAQQDHNEPAPILTNKTSISASDFEKFPEAVSKGYDAASALTESLQKLSVGESSYQKWQIATAKLALDSALVAQIKVEGLNTREANALKSQLRQTEGAPLDAEQLEADLLKTYGQGNYSKLHYQLREYQDQTILEVTPEKKGWGPNYLRSAVNVSWNNQDEARFNLRLGYHMSEVNTSGGEILAFGQLGTTNRLGLNWYQPLAKGSNWFFDSSALYRNSKLRIYDRGTMEAKYTSDQADLNAGLGYVLGSYGIVKVGALRRLQRDTLYVGSTDFYEKSFSENGNGLYALIDLDRMNRLNFPTQGWKWRTHYTKYKDYDKLQTSASIALSLGNYVLSTRLAMAGSLNSQLPFYDAVAIGGVHNIAGLAEGQILGDGLRYGGVRLEKIISKLPLGLRGDLRLGVALETATMKKRYTETQSNGRVNSLALYLGGETPIGEVYIGIAKATEGKPRLYLFFGTP